MNDTQLWDDDRILKAVSSSSVKVIGGIGIELGDRDLWFLDSGIAHTLLTQLRDDYQQALNAANERIEQLEQQLAECAQLAGSMVIELNESEGG